MVWLPLLRVKGKTCLFIAVVEILHTTWFAERDRQTGVCMCACTAMMAFGIIMGIPVCMQSLISKVFIGHTTPQSVLKSE